MRRCPVILIRASLFIVCVGACAMWVRSWTYTDTIWRVRPGPIGVRISALSSWHGKIWIRGCLTDRASSPRCAYACERADASTGYHLHIADGPPFPDSLFDYLYPDGFELPPVIVGDAFRFSIPFWTIAIVSLALPTWRLTRLWTKRQRRRLSLCLACGYDLRASPDRCPECGTETRKLAGTGQG